MRGLRDWKDQNHIASAAKFGPYGLTAFLLLTQRGLVGGPGRSGRMAIVHDDAHEIDGVSRAELLHDPAAMNLDRARAYSQSPASLLICRSGRYVSQDFAFTMRELMVARER